MTCNLPERLGADQSKGVVTTAAAADFVRHTCPCATCKAWRAKRGKLR